MREVGEISLGTVPNTKKMKRDVCKEYCRRDIPVRCSCGFETKVSEYSFKYFKGKPYICMECKKKDKKSIYQAMIAIEKRRKAIKAKR